MPIKPSTFRLHQKQQKQHRPCDQWRGRADERGYDSKWKNLRNAFITENPLCKHCEEQGRTTPATEVDHIKAFCGKNDPLRLDWQNLQSLCHSCHVKKTRREH